MSDIQESDHTSHRPFHPAFGLKNSHLQTLFSTLFRKQKEPEIEKERFELSDGDFVESFWHHRPKEHDNTPIVVLFHGLDGSFHSPYIQGVMHALRQKGFSSVLMHFRGCSGESNRMARSYHSGETGDAREWLESLVKRYPGHPLFAVGYSLGGNMLLKLLGELGKASPLIAAVSVSAPMRLEVSADQMDRGFSRFYQYILMKGLKRTLLEKYHHHDMQSLIDIDEAQVQKLRSFWEFDDVYTGPVHGFSGAKEYYEKSSARQYLNAITTDTLIIHALDDPFMTPEILPNKSDISSHVTIETSASGGHIGFIGGSIMKPRYWLDERILSFFRNRL